jgi:PhnB protein
MAKQNPSEKLDKIVERLLGRRDVPLLREEATRRFDARLTPVIEMVAGLRGLPRTEFRARLKSDLERRASMASTAKAVGEFRTTVTPYLSVRGAAAAIEFYERAFGATEASGSRFVQPDGRVGHAEINIGGARIMLADEFPEIGFRSPESLGGSPVVIHLDVADVDAVGRRAVAAGATVVRPIADQFYGDRSGQFRDPFGYTWSISTRKEELSLEEMQKRFDATTKRAEGTMPAKAAKPVNPIREGFHSITPYLVVPRAAELIDFMKAAFGAEECSRVKRPGEEIIMHAEVKIGDSMIELADANPQFPAMPSALSLRVSDPDAVYDRALTAGAQMVEPVTDKPYGTRAGTVRDAAGNNLHIFMPLPGDKIFAEFRSVTPHLYADNGPQLIEFLHKAFGGVEIYRAQLADGSIPHAQVRIGDSVVAIAGSRGQGLYPVRPTTLHLYVADADAVYEQALREGATSIQPVADQPYGDRSGGVTDPFGNRWFIATHIRDVAF